MIGRLNCLCVGFFMAEECNYFDFVVMYSFGFSILSPIGAMVLRRWVQCFSRLLLMVIACVDLGCFFINSNTVMSMFLTPSCPGVEKCFPTLLSAELSSTSL